MGNCCILAPEAASHSQVVGQRICALVCCFCEVYGQVLLFPLINGLVGSILHTRDLMTGLFMKVKERGCNQCVISIFHFNEATDFAVFQSILLQVFLKTISFIMAMHMVWFSDIAFCSLDHGNCHLLGW